MRKLTLSAVLSADGNAYDPTYSWNLSAVESDLASQALSQVGTTEPDGTQDWTWNKTDDVPLSIPVDLPFGIKEVLHESLALAASVTVSLAPALAPASAPAVA